MHGGGLLDNRTAAEVTLHNVDGLLRELEGKMNLHFRSVMGHVYSGAVSWNRNLPTSESWTLNRRWSRMLSKHRSRYLRRTERVRWRTRTHSQWNMLTPWFRNDRIMLR